MQIFIARAALATDEGYQVARRLLGDFSKKMM